VGARLGRAHCALCDITHGLVRERPEWKQRRAELAVPFDTYHRNDQPDSVRSAAHDVAPVVLAETESGIVELLGPRELDACNGDTNLLVEAIDAAMTRAGLSWS
jgi:hypothetical protein